jgi:hypothetical protein
LHGETTVTGGVAPAVLQRKTTAIVSKMKVHCIHVAAFAKRTSQRKTDRKINQQNTL